MATAKKSTAKKAAPRKAATTRSTAKRNTTTRATTKVVKSTPKVETVSTRQGRSVVVGPVDVKAIASETAYFTVGAGDRAVEAVRELPTTLETLRKQRAQRTADVINGNRAKAESFLKDVPAKAESLVKGVPTKLQGETRENLESARKEVDTLVTRGRKVVASISNAKSTQRALDQTETARSQVKGAVTSIRKAVEQSQEAVEVAVGRIGVRR